VFELEFNGKHIIGLDAFRLDHSLQFVIEVPSCEAYSDQDPRVEPTSLTFQPSSRHGVPHIIVPIRMGPARIPCGPSRLKLPLPPDLEDSEDSKEPIGNPYAALPEDLEDSKEPIGNAYATLPLSPPATPVKHKQNQHKQDRSPPRASVKSIATSVLRKEQEKAGASSSNASPSRGQLNSELRLSRSNERLPSSRLTPRTPKHEGSPPSRLGDEFELLQIDVAVEATQPSVLRRSTSSPSPSLA
jgi:hypothetical protein